MDHQDIGHSPRHRGWRNHHRIHDRAAGMHHFFGHGRGGRSVRRGNVRFAILSVLQDGPMHGYQIITELESRTRGVWRPSAGSVYPTLQLLEDEGLLTSAEVDGRRTFSLSDAGRKAAEEHPLTADRWLEADATGMPDLHKLAKALVSAAAEVEKIGTPDAIASAREVLADARRRLYRLLADDEAETTP